MEPSHIAGGNVISVAAMENSMAVPKKLNLEIL